MREFTNFFIGYLTGYFETMCPVHCQDFSKSVKSDGIRFGVKDGINFDQQEEE